jgi:hypothetical protein
MDKVGFVCIAIGTLHDLKFKHISWIKLTIISTGGICGITTAEKMIHKVHLNSMKMCLFYIFFYVIILVSFIYL